MHRHMKTFRAFNGQDCWNEPLTLRPPEGYVGTHRREVPRNGMVIWHSRAQVFAEITAAGMYRTVE